MRRARFLIFLLPVFFISAWVYAVNPACKKQQESITTSYHHATSNCSNADAARNQLPAVLELHPTSFPLSFTGSQKFINCNEHLFTGLYNPLIRAGSVVVTSDFLKQKNYLFYIYPSHDFW